MAKIRIGENLEARIELPKVEVPVVVPEPQIIEKVVQIVEFDYSKVAPYIKELNDKIDSVQQFAMSLSNPVTQVIEKKEVLPVETKVVNIVTHDKEDIEKLQNELKDMYDELKTDITSLITKEEVVVPAPVVVDHTEKITKLNKKVKKLEKYLLCAVVVILILNLI